MNKKMMRIITILATIVLVVSVSSIAFATDAKNITEQINGSGNVTTSGVINAGNKIATIIRVVGAVAAVIILMILGIKYMMGSASEKAEYKKTMIPYVVGAVVLFGATAIAGAVVELAGGITTDSTGVTPPPRTSISGQQQ